MSFRKEMAEVFHECVCVERKDIFGENDPIPISWQDDARLMFPGVVGAEYAPGGVLLMAINPGGGKDTYSAKQREKYGDDRLYPAMGKFKSARGKDVYSSFNELNHIARNVMRNWPTWKYMVAAIRAVGVADENFVYINAVPYRVRNNDIKLITVEAFHRAKDLVVSKQISFLKPKTLIIIGKTTGNVIGDYYRSVVSNCYVVPGTKWWRYITPEAEKVFKRISQEKGNGGVEVPAVQDDSMSKVEVNPNKSTVRTKQDINKQPGFEIYKDIDKIKKTYRMIKGKALREKVLKYCLDNYDNTDVEKEKRALLLNLLVAAPRGVYFPLPDSIKSADGTGTIRLWSLYAPKGVNCQTDKAPGQEFRLPKLSSSAEDKGKIEIREVSI